MKLFNLNFSTCLLEGSLKSFSLCLRNFLLNSDRRLVNKLLSLLKTKTSCFLNSLNNAKLSLTC